MMNFQPFFLQFSSWNLRDTYNFPIRQTPCFNTDNLTWMQKEAMRQGISNFGMHGGIVIDEMSIQDDIVISRRSDSWDLVGIVDMDTTNNNIFCIFFSPLNERTDGHNNHYIPAAFSKRWVYNYVNNAMIKGVMDRIKGESETGRMEW
jgi:hypothetical protein